MAVLYANVRISPETASLIPGGMFLLGALTIIGLYHLGISVYRNNEKAPLLIFAYCLLFGIRLIYSNTDPMFSFIAELSESVRMEIAYLALYLCVPVYSALMQDLYPIEMSPVWHRYSKYIFLPLAGLILFLPADFLGYAYRLSYVIITVFVFYWASVSARALAHKREGALLGNIGGKLFAVTVLNDILYLNGFIQTGQIAYWGLLFLIICQSLILSMRLSNAFTRMEEMSVELRGLNADLELKVQERTRDLDESRLELLKTNHTLQRLTIVDGLTNLYNRRYLDQKLVELRDVSDREDKILSIIMLDIDFFKIFNDTYGHLAGDDCLKHVAEVLIFHNSDECHPFRYGGEEFILATITDHANQAFELSELVRKEIRKLNIDHRGSPFGKVTISAGIASIRPKTLDADWDIMKLVNNADHALYQAKHNGRNQSVVF